MWKQEMQLCGSRRRLKPSFPERMRIGVLLSQQTGDCFRREANMSVDTYTSPRADAG